MAITKERKPTLKQMKFAREVLATGNLTEAARRVYNVSNDKVAQNIGSDNMAKPIVRDLIEAQAREALNDQLDIRTELRESKTDYSVRAKVNMDILDRAGFKPVEKVQTSSINLNIDISDPRAKEVKERFEAELLKTLE